MKNTIIYWYGGNKELKGDNMSISANKAKQMSIKNQKKNNAIQQSIKWTDNNIEKAIKNGKRECVLVWDGADNIETIKRHFEELGYKVGQFKPPQITFYVRW